MLDGDVFQPLWCNWFAAGAPRADGRTDPFATVESVGAFFGGRIVRRAVGFPYRYVVLGADTTTLRARVNGDGTRRRRNFDYHLRLAAPQRADFERQGRHRPELVRFVDTASENADVDAVGSEGTASRDVAGTVASLCPDGASVAGRYDAVTLSEVVEWLTSTDPTAV